MHKYFQKILEFSIDENNYYRPSRTVWKTVESQGKVIEMSGNLEMDIELQPCNTSLAGCNKGADQPAYSTHIFEAKSEFVVFLFSVFKVYSAKV